MRILVAPDKFKDSLSAAEVANQIAAGLREILPDAEIETLPVADGGEGTAEVILRALAGEWREVEVHDPLGQSVRARYGAISQGATAVMEMSQASGLWRVPLAQRDPVRADTFGTGEMLLDAIARGAKEIVIGLGGSATNDGGFGLARALGFKFWDERDRELTGPVSDLLRLKRMERPQVLRLPSIIAAVDVRNHLLGENGATRVYGAQKGATPEGIELLERALENLAQVARQDFGVDFCDQLGAGAAGGLGYGLMTFCGAKLRSGFDVVAEAIDLRARVAAADVIVTGEGRLDPQTREGKAPAGVARLARAEGKPIFAIVGNATNDGGKLFDRVFVLARPPLSEAEAIADAGNLLQLRARELGEILRQRA